MKTEHDQQGADWWERALTRREAGARIAGIAAGLAVLPALGALAGCGDETEEIAESDALALQQQSGWNVGAESDSLKITGRTTQDSRGGSNWTQYRDPQKLLSAWSVSDKRWQPYVVPTLIQSLAQPTLARSIAPVHTPAMDTAYARGLGMREILLKTDRPDQVAIVADLHGPEAVAFAAAIADVADPVLTFDNWPHPTGVVAAEETLGALLYYADEVAKKQSVRLAGRAPSATASGATTNGASASDSAGTTVATPAGSARTMVPAVFVLDSDRLQATTTGSETEFDNRYIAKLPEPSNLTSAGVNNVLYAVPDNNRTTELDDLNDYFAGYGENGINVAMVPLTDFRPEEGAGAADTTRRAPRGNAYGYYHTPHFYGGGLAYLPLFFMTYPSYGYVGGRVPPGRFQGGRVTRPTYQPVRRPTVFSSRTSGATAGVGRTKPTGFGRVSRSTSGSGGSSFGGRRSGSSGSFGRARGGGSM